MECDVLSMCVILSVAVREIRIAELEGRGFNV